MVDEKKREGEQYVFMRSLGVLVPRCFVFFTVCLCSFATDPGV